MSVVWKDVVGFEDYFKISEYGDLWSKRSSKILSKHLNKYGYFTVSTKIGGRNGISYCFKLHRLVAEAFLEQPSQELAEACAKQAHGIVIVRHQDDNKQNNHYSNLLWGTYQDNTDDFKKSSNYDKYKLKQLEEQSGTKSSQSNFTELDVQYIRDNYKKSCKTFGARALAKQFNVHHTTISRMVRNLRYKTI